MTKLPSYGTGHDAEMLVMESLSQLCAMRSCGLENLRLHWNNRSDVLETGQRQERLDHGREAVAADVSAAVAVTPRCQRT